MLNQVQLIGHIQDVYQNKSGEWYLDLAVERSFKDYEGHFLTDYLTCKIWKAVAEFYSRTCHKGQLVGLVGRLSALKGEKLDIECTYIDFLK